MNSIINDVLYVIVNAEGGGGNAKKLTDSNGESSFWLSNSFLGYAIFSILLPLLMVLICLIIKKMYKNKTINKKDNKYG